MQQGGGTEWDYNSNQWVASGYTRYSVIEAMLLNELDVRIGIDISIKSDKIPAHWWAMTSQKSFYQCLKRKLERLPDINKPKVTPDVFLMYIKHLLQQIISLRTKRNLEFFLYDYGIPREHFPANIVTRSRTREFSEYIKFIKAYGRHLHYLNSIYIGFYLIKNSSAQSILNESSRQLKNKLAIAKELTIQMCEKEHQFPPARKYWRDDFNKHSFNLIYGEPEWNKKPLLCYQIQKSYTKSYKKSYTKARGIRKGKKKQSRRKRQSK